MNRPSSTIQAAGFAGFLAATILLYIKIRHPEIYEQIPASYEPYLVVGISVIVGYFKRENVLPIDRDKV